MNLMNYSNTIANAITSFKDHYGQTPLINDALKTSTRYPDHSARHSALLLNDQHLAAFMQHISSWNSKNVEKSGLNYDLFCQTLLIYSHSLLRIDVCYINCPSTSKGNLFNFVSTAFKLDFSGNWTYKPCYGDSYESYTKDIHQQFICEAHSLDIWAIKA